MSLTVSHLYEFGRFRLDTGERILTRDGETVDLTPKGFELLSVLVENHGRLLGKDELMNRVWADAFVEEGNLTFNIRQLRILLEDDAHNPTYIKTIRRHGYRFIADVRQISKELDRPAARNFVPATGGGEVESLPPDDPMQIRPGASSLFWLLLVIVPSALIIGTWYLEGHIRAPANSVATSKLTIERISSNGTAELAAVSPDGKNVVYLSGAEKPSVWLRQLDSGNNTELIPEIDQGYIDFAFAPDGASLYFSRHTIPTTIVGSGIYRVPVFGGVPEKIISDVLTPVGVSPDGSRLAFVRHKFTDEEYVAIYTADAATGANERKILGLPKPLYVRDLNFSTDGTRIVFALGQFQNMTNVVDLAEVDLETGTQRGLTNEKFFDIKSIAPLPNNAGWLVAGSKMPVTNYQIWKVSSSGAGESVPVTQDASYYDGVSVDLAAAKIVATQLRYDYHLRFVSLESGPDKFEPINGDTADIAPDGKIFFTSFTSGDPEIWSANADGSNRRQLTNNNSEEDSPTVSPDNETVYFASVQTGKWRIWRMNTDGSNQKQVSSDNGGFPLVVTPDGEWLYYAEHDYGALWRIALKSGKEELVLDRKPYNYTGVKVVPDGSLAAMVERQDDRIGISIIALPEGKVVKRIFPSDKKLVIQNLGWTKDGGSLFYVTKNLVAPGNALWIQPLNGGPPHQIAVLSNEDVNAANMPVTPDGKFIVVPQGSGRHDAVLLKEVR